MSTKLVPFKPRWNSITGSRQNDWYWMNFVHPPHNFQTGDWVVCTVPGEYIIVPDQERGNGRSVRYSCHKAVRIDIRHYSIRTIWYLHEESTQPPFDRLLHIIDESQRYTSRTIWGRIDKTHSPQFDPNHSYYCLIGSRSCAFFFYLWNMDDEKKMVEFLPMFLAITEEDMQTKYSLDQWPTNLYKFYPSQPMLDYQNEIWWIQRWNEQRLHELIRFLYPPDLAKIVLQFLGKDVNACRMWLRTQKSGELQQHFLLHRQQQREETQKWPTVNPISVKNYH
jgi:hypothetical protein